MNTVYLNGAFTNIDDAKISVLDRGWIFGDGIYEVIPIYNGHLFRMTEHLKRLNDNLNAIQLRSPYSQQEWLDITEKLIQKNSVRQDSALYLQVTRGVAKREHTFPDDTNASAFAMIQAINNEDIIRLQKGIYAITHPDIRWQYCNIKSISLLANVLLKQEAKKQGADEALLIKDGLVTEGSASNLFIVHNQTLVTPPKSASLLPGITRDLILELATQHHMPSIEKDIPEAMLQEATEVWVSSSTKEILPVIQINSQPIGNGEPGPIWKSMIKYYQQFKAEFTGEVSSSH